VQTQWTKVNNMHTSAHHVLLPAARDVRLCTSFSLPYLPSPCASDWPHLLALSSCWTTSPQAQKISS